MKVKELSAPPHDPVVWLVRRRDNGAVARVVAQTAYFALQQGSILLKAGPDAPCLDPCEMTARPRSAV